MSSNIDPEDLESFTPEGIAHNIFTKEPKNPCSCQLVAEQDSMDITYLFEILSIILMEGLEIFTGDLSKSNLNALSISHIDSLNPWFRSIGFDILVSEHNVSNNTEYNKHYCKIMIRDKLQEIFFEMKNIDKNYHFVLNGDSLDENKHKTNLKDLHLICIIGDKVFKISFKFHHSETTVESS